VKQDERSVQITLQAGSATETINADRAICTLPCPAIGKIFQDARLSDGKQRAIREQNYSRTVKVFLQSRRRFWLKDRFSGNVTADLPIERLTSDPGTEVDERGALTAYPIGPYTAALERMTEEERVSAAFGQARQIFPELGASFEGGIAHCWGLDPWQRGFVRVAHAGPDGLPGHAGVPGRADPFRR
jgi:monoamine oxidase